MTVDKGVIGILAPYLASRLLLVIDRNKKSSTLLRLHLIEKKNIMAHLIYSVSRNNASVLSKIADNNLPILSNFIWHVPLRIILVNSVNASLHHQSITVNFSHAIPSQNLSLCQIIFNGTMKNVMFLVANQITLT